MQCGGLPPAPPPSGRGGWPASTSPPGCWPACGASRQPEIISMRHGHPGTLTFHVRGAALSNFMGIPFWRGISSPPEQSNTPQLVIPQCLQEPCKEPKRSSQTMPFSFTCQAMPILGLHSISAAGLLRKCPLGHSCKRCIKSGDSRSMEHNTRNLGTLNTIFLRTLLHMRGKSLPQ